jgi:DNA polymerase-3 subunit gamma/tau
MSQALYRKYRPQGWGEVIGQEHVVQTIRNAIAADRVSHAYLFAGSRGTGKTTLARLLAKAVNCLAEKRTDRPCNECEFCKAVNENRFMDLIEIDAASNTSVDDVRDLRDKINFTPTQGKYKIYIIDEVHMLSTAAFNALLKTLEEPPPHAIFVLATTEIHKIPATILSRCQRHEFRRLSVDEILANLKQISKAEGLKVDEQALTLIARQATGSLRDAQSLLDQLASTDTHITLTLAQSVLGTATSQAVLDLITSVRDHDAAAGLETIHHALDSGADARSLARQIVDYLRGLMLIKMGNADHVEATAEVKKQMQAYVEAFTPSDMLRMMKAFNTAATDLRGGWLPSLNLELALAELLETPGVVSPSSSAPTTTMPSRPASQDQKETGQKSVVHRSADGITTSTDAPKADQPVISAGEVVKVWKQISHTLSKSQANLAALMNSVKLIDVQGKTLLLGFGGEVLVKQMEKPEYIEIMRKALTEALGVELDIRCVLTNARGKLPPNISQDGMVATALNQGGEIVDVQE